MTKAIPYGHPLAINNNINTHNNLRQRDPDELNWAQDSALLCEKITEASHWWHVCRDWEQAPVTSKRSHANFNALFRLRPHRMNSLLTREIERPRPLREARITFLCEYTEGHARREMHCLKHDVLELYCRGDMRTGAYFTAIYTMLTQFATAVSEKVRKMFEDNKDYI